MDSRLRGNDVALELPKELPGAPRAVPITPQQALQRTIEHREIFHDEMVDLMGQIMRGEVTPAMVAAILTEHGHALLRNFIGERRQAA